MSASGGRRNEPLRKRSAAPVLGIDTSTSQASLALVRNGRDLDGIAWRADRRQTIEVPPRLEEMLSKHGLSPGDLGGVAVGLGPGAFTSLRVGVSLAKGLAMGSNLHLVGVPTLEALASSEAAEERRVWALLEAGRGRFSAARYVITGGAARRDGGYHLGSLEELAAQMEPRSLVMGDLNADAVRRLSQRLGPRATIVPIDDLRPRASWVARLGAERLSRGESDDPASLEPIYLPSPSKGS